MAELLGPAIEVVKCVAAPIKRQFNYLCCFNNIIRNLREETEKLDDANKGLQMQIVAATNNVQVIVPEVEVWLKNSEEMKSNKDIILNEVSNVESGCLKLRDRFFLSRRAKKATDQIKDHRDICKSFNNISQPPPPAATEAVPLEKPIEFESRKHLEKEIMETLRCIDVNMIGICGMGGVGKTTMAKKIMNRALKEDLCDEVVIVVVSQQADNLRIQVEIGRSLALELGNESPQSRAQKLHARLSGPKRILLVLDDVWGRLKLEDLGIPCGSGCKILVTSRNRDVLSAMNVPKICGIQILSNMEAWTLFREKAGDCVDVAGVKAIALKVVKESKGLPIALAAAGVALGNENNLYIWEDALRQLTKSNPSDIPNIIAEVYNPLKMSYDFLDNDHAKSIFLLCCLFGEDDDIPLEHLVYFSVGLRMFEGIYELEETRGRMFALIKMLKNRYLLLDGSDEYHVKMHDVIRDVCIFIASKERFINCTDCNWISSYVDGRPRVPESGFPNLHLLFLNNKVEPEFQINDSFTERARELNVLFIRYSPVISVASIPHNTSQLLKNLVTLVIFNCYSLESIAHVGRLVSLEILICHDCSLAEVPVELRGLKRLRLLQISECRNLNRVAPGVISSLVALEELKIVESFRNWEAGIEGIERENAGLEELESLTNLRCLEIQVLNFMLAVVQLHLSSKLVKFNVTFGKLSRAPTEIYHKKLSLYFEKNFCGDLSTNTFVRSTEYLDAYGPGSNFNLKLAKAQHIKWLSLFEFENLKNLTALVDWRSCDAVFPLLESLRLEDIDSLEEIWDGSIPSYSFKNLKQLRLDYLPGLKQLWRSPYDNDGPIFSNLSSVIIYKCHGLRYLFSLAEAKDCCLQLESIEIKSCGAMEQVLLLRNEEEEEESELKEGSWITIFPKLKSLEIIRLPKLMSICKGIERIEFPLLTEISIIECPRINRLVSKSGINGDHYHDLASTHLFCESKVSFGNLKNLTIMDVSNKNAWCNQVPTCFFQGLEMLTIGNYSNITSLFSSSIAKNLVNLKVMKVIEDNEDKDTCDGRRKCLFPRLQKLHLPKLESFCQYRCAVEFPSLKTLGISWCDELRSFNAGPVITPALLTIRKYGLNCSSVEDINAVLQQHFAGAQEKQRNADMKTKEDIEETEETEENKTENV